MSAEILLNSPQLWYSFLFRTPTLAKVKIRASQSVRPEFFSMNWLQKHSYLEISTSILAQLLPQASASSVLQLWYSFSSI